MDLTVLNPCHHLEHQPLRWCERPNTTPFVVARCQLPMLAITTVTLSWFGCCAASTSASSLLTTLTGLCLRCILSTSVIDRGSTVRVPLCRFYLAPYCCSYFQLCLASLKTPFFSGRLLHLLWMYTKDPVSPWIHSFIPS